MKKSFIYIILAGILWGSSGIFVHYLAPLGLSSMQMTAARSIVGTICVAVYLLIRNRKAFSVTGKELALCIGSGMGFFFTGTCYFASMQMTSVSTAVVLMYTAPILVMIYSVAFLGEKLTGFKALSVVIMLVGCALVSGIVGGFKFDLIGIAVGFASGIAYSAYNIFTKLQMRNKCHPITATMYCFVFAAAISILVCKPLEIVDVVVRTPHSLILLVSCGICNCVLPYVFYTLALKELPAGTASSLGIVEPLAATVFSVTLLDEKLTVFSVIGIILIIGAVLMLSKNKEE